MGIDNFNGWPRTAPLRGWLISSARFPARLPKPRGRTDAIKLITLAQGQNPGRVEMGNYMFDFTPVPARAGAAARAAASPPAAGAGNEFLPGQPLCAHPQHRPRRVLLRDRRELPVPGFHANPGANTAAAATIDRGYFSNGKWTLAHRLNGDDILTADDLSGAAANHQAGTVIPLGSRGRWNAPFAQAGRHVPRPNLLARDVLSVSLSR